MSQQDTVSASDVLSIRSPASGVTDEVHVESSSHGEPCHETPDQTIAALTAERDALRAELDSRSPFEVPDGWLLVAIPASSKFDPSSPAAAVAFSQLMEQVWPQLEASSLDAAG